MTVYFIQAFIYLCAAVIAVPIAKRLGLGSVLGYLIAGVVIGPITGLVGSETVTIQHFAEFGVVMMLFLVGLELEPRMLWGLRHKLVGLGGLQVTLSCLLITGICLSFGYHWRLSLAIGLILSLSSTAIVLQTFQEKGLAKTEGGKAAFSVLLFQDIAVIPMLAFIPLLALPELVSTGTVVVDGGHESIDLTSHLPGWLYALVVLGTIAALVFGGQFLARPLFRFIANTGLREMFTATTLLLVIGIAALMNLVGLSPALGTFLAGVILANSEFRHELETNIEPFKGLLLGLFFITVGAGINFSVIANNLWIVVAAVSGVLLLKGAVLFFLAQLFNIKRNDGWLFTLSLSQAGEFGFVLLSFAVQHQALPQTIADIVSPVIAITMFLTPLLFILFDRLVTRFYRHNANPLETDTIDDQGPVIIAGIGRFGQIVNRLLVANDIHTVVLDYSAAVIDNLSKVNIKTWYGDATRPDLLHSAGIAEASLLVVAIDDRYRALDLVEHVKKSHPHITVMARAYDRTHGYELADAGADIIVSETYFSALELGGEALKALNVHPFKVEQMKQAFRRADDDSREEIYREWLKSEPDNRFTSDYIALLIAMEKRMNSAIKHHRLDGHDTSEHGWTPPPKHYQDELK